MNLFTLTTLYPMCGYEFSAHTLSSAECIANLSEMELVNVARWARTNRMTAASDCIATIPATADTTRRSLSTEELPKLVFAAAATLDSDRAAAKACLLRAIELLRATCGERSVPAVQWSRGGLAPWQKRNVIAHITANLGYTIRIGDLARVAKLSVGHFFRVFRETFGETPLVYIERRRIEHAQKLMVSSPASLSRIAVDCGMHDQSHFTRVFRRFVGVNPGAWRRQFSAGGSDTPEVRGAPLATGNLTVVQYAVRRVP